MRTVGHYAGKLRRAAADFQRQFEEAMRETEIDEVRKAIESVRENTSSADLKAPIDKPVIRLPVLSRPELRRP
jgi:sec-independent protein translocase protein TatB